MTAIEQLGAQIARGTQGAQLAERIALHIGDTTAAWVAGARSDEGRALLAFGASLQGASMADRVLVRCAVTRLSEVDDIHLASGTTPGSVVIPAALTVGAERGAPAALIREAIAAGYETMVRFGVAFNGPTILYRGIWPTYFTAPAGVAAVTARLLGLDEKQTAHALALALVFSSPGVAHPAGPRMGRWLSLGHAARHGVTAAVAAQEGFTGDVQLLEKDFFSAIYAITPDAKVIAEGLGKPALAGVSLKPWCAARQTIAASQAVKELAQDGLKAEDIREIHVSVPPPYLKMVNHGVIKGDRSSYLTSVPCQVALSLVDPSEQYALKPEPSRITPAVETLMGKVVVEADEKLLQHFPRTWPARVRVTTSMGMLEKEMLHVPGDPERVFSAAQAEHKFGRVLGRVIGEQASGGLWSQSQRASSQDGAAADLVKGISQAIG